MPSMSGQTKHEVITNENADEQICAERCSTIGINNKDAVTMKRSNCSPQRLKNIALSDMLSEFQDEGISSPPADLAATFNTGEEASMLYSGECMEMNNDILDLTKPLQWDSTCGLKKGNSSISLDSLNDNYIESQDGIVDSEKVETNDDGEECSCGENVSPACPVHREKALLTEEIQRTCSSLVESLKVETPNENNNDVSSSSQSSKKRKKQKAKKRDALEDLYSSLESRDFEAYLKSRTSLRTLDMMSPCDLDSCSTDSSSSRLYRKGSQDTYEGDESSRVSSTDSSNFSVPSVHKSDLSSSPESYDLLYKSFEAAVMIEKDDEGGGEEEANEDDAPSLTPLEMFNQASPKLQKALSRRQQRALEGVHSDNEQNEAMESSGMYDTRLCQSLPSKQLSCEKVDLTNGQKVTTFAQLAKTRKKADVIQAPQTLTIKPTHWSEIVANQEKKNCEKSESGDDSSPDDANTPKRPHSLPIQLRFITKPASRPTQTPEQTQPGGGNLFRGVTRTISAPEGFGADGLPVEINHQPEMTRTTSWGQSQTTNTTISSAPGNLTNKFSIQKQASLPVSLLPPLPPSQSLFNPHQSSTPYQSLAPQQRPQRQYSPSMDINANFTDDDLDETLSNNSPDTEFRIHNTSPQRTPPQSWSPNKPRRCVSWSDVPDGYQPCLDPADATANTTTFKQMTPVPSKSASFEDSTGSQTEMDSTPSWYRVRSATVGATRVSLKDLWQRIDEENVVSGDVVPQSVTTWAQSVNHQQRVMEVEKNSVGCQVDDEYLPHSMSRKCLTKCDSFESMLAENGLSQSVNGYHGYNDMGRFFADNSPWLRPRSKTFLSLHKDPIRTLQNVRSVKYEPKVKTWLVDCNKVKPSRVTCEDMLSDEQRPRRLVRIENITDGSDVKYIRHRPLKPIHVVDAEYKRRKALEQLNALDAPNSTPPARYAPSFSEFIASDNYQSLPPNLERYRHWLSNSDGQSQSSIDSNQPFRERISSDSAADMHKVYSGNLSHMQERPHSLVLASYCDDGMEALPPQEIPVSPRFVGHHDTVDMLRKRAIVAAIDGAVDHILGHFAQAINKSPLEKVRLGDSQQTPNVGHIVLHYLCPAIGDLLMDGLKPYMQSFIVGRVKTTVWTPVEATTRLGPGTRSLYELVSTLSKLRYLKEPSMKANAFIFGLLNTRNMEIWMEHIRSHPDIIRTLYEPEAFLSLCNTSTRQLFDKLLLALQPLAILPFNLDYQFEHNYMQQQASIIREKQQLQEQHTKLGSMHRQGSLPDQRRSPEGGRASGRFSSLLGRGSRKDLNRSNSWASSLSSSFGFGKSFAGQSSGRGQTQSSEQSESDRLLRTVNTSPSKDTTEEEMGGSSDTTPTNSTQTWSLDWIKSFVAASDQSPTKSVESTTTSSAVAAPAQEPPNTGSSWSRFGASMFKSFSRMRQTEPQQQQKQSTPKQPELVQIEEQRPSPPGSPCKQMTTDPWNKASPGSPMKALCHHVTMSPGELSFSKGDILTVDHQVDPDWLLCHHGRESGLVHIDYVQGFE